MKNTVKISVADFLNMIINWGIGAAPSSISYITEPELTKEGKAKFGKVTKVANVGCMIGYDYANSVNNEREREGLLRNFMAEQLWKGAGERISTACAKHKTKGTFYLTYKKQQTFKSFYFDEALNIIPNNVIKAYFKPLGDSGKQGVDKPVYHREIALANVRKVKFRKTTYELIHQ